jgi:hypothetical protein
VARGGIEPPTQGFSTPLLDSTSLLNQKVTPPEKNFVQNIRAHKNSISFNPMIYWNNSTDTY